MLDASLALAWALPDEASRYTDDMLTRVAAGKAWVPPLWPYDMANGLAMAERRGRLSTMQRSAFIDELLKLPIEVELRPARMVLETLVSLAAAHGLTAYDAAYLDLSVRKGLTLMTQDKALRGAALKLGVPIA